MASMGDLMTDGAPSGVLAAEEIAFEALYRRDYRAVVGLIYGLTGSMPAAGEIAQDAFVTAHRKWAEIGAFDDPGAWVRHIALNAARSMRRRVVSEVRALARPSGRRGSPVEMPADCSRFWAALRSLPVRQAQALALHYYEDKSIAEIANVMRCGAATVKTHLFRGRSSLAVTLGYEENE